VHIINVVHVAGDFYNDISPDNIMFYFPEDESCIYIGVCNWNMTIVSTDLVNSLYIFTSTNDKHEALRRRWWMDPNITYVHRRNVDVEIISN